MEGGEGQDGREALWPMVDGGMSERRALRPLEELAVDEQHERELEENAERERRTAARGESACVGAVGTKRFMTRGLASLHRTQHQRRKRTRISKPTTTRGALVEMNKETQRHHGDSDEDDNDDDDDDYAGAIALPSDTELAIWTLRAQFPRRHLGDEVRYTAPVVLRSQLYALLDDHLDADKQLLLLRTNGTIREVALLGTAHDRVIVLTQDVTQLCLEHAKATAQSKSDAARREALLQLVFNQVFPRCTGLFVSRTELHSALDSSNTGNVPPESSLDDSVSAMVRLGLLVQRDAASFWFALPQMAAVSSWIRGGRQQLLAKLGRARFGQMLLGKVARERLNKSKLEPMFHVRDVVGRGEVAVLATAQGPLLRLERDAQP